MRERDEEMDSQGGHRRGGGRAVVRLDTAALWDRLEMLNRSQNWLAREAGMSKSYLSKLVSEGRAPSEGIRCRMLEALGLYDLNQLFTLEVNDEPT